MRTTEIETGVGKILFRYPNRKDAYLIFNTLPLLPVSDDERKEIVLTPEGVENDKIQKMFDTLLPAYDALLIRCAKKPRLFSDPARVSTEDAIDIEELEVSERLQAGIKLMQLSGFTTEVAEELAPLDETKTP